VDELRDACEVPWINDGYAQTLGPGKPRRRARGCGLWGRSKRQLSQRIADHAIPQQIQIDAMPALTNT
jgi:hypothetical protein